jgi:hypothetical protein
VVPIYEEPKTKRRGISATASVFIVINTQEDGEPGGMGWVSVASSGRRVILQRALAAGSDDPVAADGEHKILEPTPSPAQPTAAQR